MRVDPSGNVAAFMKLAANANLPDQYATAVLKKALDATAANAAQLIQALDPNVGRNVDVRA